MMPQEITYYCSICDERETVTAPTTFETKCGGDVEDAFCQSHSGCKAFLDDVCPGCVSGWGECGLYGAIGNGKVTEADLKSIKSGLCPYRTNGTMLFTAGMGMKRVDLSTKSKAGEVFAAAINKTERAA